MFHIIFIINANVDICDKILEKKYEINDLWEFYYYIDFIFIQDCIECTITMSQNKYIKEVLKHFKNERVQDYWYFTSSQIIVNKSI